MVWRCQSRNFVARLGDFFKAFRGDYRDFSEEIFYSFQRDFRCLGDFLMLIIFGNPGLSQRCVNRNCPQEVRSEVYKKCHHFANIFPATINKH